MVTIYEGEPICRCIDSDSGPVGFHNTQGLRCYLSINFFIKILYKLLAVNQVYTTSYYKTTTSKANFHIELPICTHNCVLICVLFEVYYIHQTIPRLRTTENCEVSLRRRSTKWSLESGRYRQKERVLSVLENSRRKALSEKLVMSSEQFTSIRFWHRYINGHWTLIPATAVADFFFFPR